MATRVLRALRAQALVETAILLPVMLTLTMGVIDVCFLAYAHVQVVNASREGAFAASQYEYQHTASSATNNSNRLAQARTAAERALGNLETAPLTTAIEYPVGAPTAASPSGQRIRVTLAYNYNLPVSSSFGLGVASVTLNRATVVVVRSK